MNKKLMAGILAGLVLVGGIYGAYKMDVFYKKTPEAALKTPDWKIGRTIENPNYVNYVDPYDIHKNTDPLGGVAAKYYTKYIDYMAPNGKPIRLVAQNEVTDEQVLYAYSLLDFYLTDTEGKKKMDIANQMADQKATLVIPNGADRDGKTSALAKSLGQNLHYAEIANVGSKWYTENDYNHRDAAFEEIFHMVHDYGIGTTKKPLSDPDTMNMIKAGLDAALPVVDGKRGSEGIWAVGMTDQINEWANEGSLEQEYIVSVIDSYYGMWEAFPKPGGMYGFYTPKGRADVKTLDPKGYAVVKTFLSPYITSQMRVDPSFEGTFKMYKEEKTPYTYKSQYLKNVTLTGDKNTSLIGNDQDNILMGNAGDNLIDGRGGQDVLQLRGKLSDYDVTKVEGKVIIKDKIKGRDGRLTLENIERLRFTDQELSAGDLQ